MIISCVQLCWSIIHICWKIGWNGFSGLDAKVGFQFYVVFKKEKYLWKTVRLVRKPLWKFKKRWKNLLYFGSPIQNHFRYHFGITQPKEPLCNRTTLPTDCFELTDPAQEIRDVRPFQATSHLFSAPFTLRPFTFAANTYVHAPVFKSCK